MASTIKWFSRAEGILRMGPFDTEAAALKSIWTIEGGPAKGAFLWKEKVSTRKPRQRTKSRAQVEIDVWQFDRGLQGALSQIETIHRSPRFATNLSGPGACVSGPITRTRVRWVSYGPHKYEVKMREGRACIFLPGNETLMAV
jgi:hypothetical protein